MPLGRRVSRAPKAATSYKPPARSAPAREEREEEGDDGKSIRTGWGGYKSTKDAAPSKWPKMYKIPDDGEHLIFFLEDAPFASYNQHWCDWVGQGQKKSYTCLGEGCPLCEVDNPSPRVRFNILDLDGDEPTLKVWETGITVTDTLLKYGEDPKTGPLGRMDMYFGVQLSGGPKKKTTSVRPIKGRDVEEDWQYELLTEEEVEKAMTKAWDDTSVDKVTKAELRKLAESATQ